MSNSNLMGLIPVSDGWLSQKFSAGHKGLDIGWHNIEKCDVRAWNDGEVIAYGADAAKAWFIVLKHDNGQLSGYWHLDKCPVLHNGDRVKKGQKIGIRGNSGKASGTHLHFLLTDAYDPAHYSYNTMIAHTIDPLPWLYRLKTDVSFVPGADGFNLLDLPLETREIDPEAVKKAMNESIKALLERVYGELGFNVEQYTLSYKLKGK